MNRIRLGPKLNKITRIKLIKIDNNSSKKNFRQEQETIGFHLIED